MLSVKLWTPSICSEGKFYQRPYPGPCRRFIAYEAQISVLGVGALAGVTVLPCRPPALNTSRSRHDPQCERLERTVIISHRDLARARHDNALPCPRFGELAAAGRADQFELVAASQVPISAHPPRRTGPGDRRSGRSHCAPPNPEQVAIGAPPCPISSLGSVRQTCAPFRFRGRLSRSTSSRAPSARRLPASVRRAAQKQSASATRWAGTDAAFHHYRSHFNRRRASGYAKIWNARPDGWRFLTGPDGEIEAAARRFGMSYWPEEGLITHTSQTGVIARDGRLAARVDGSSFAAGQLGDLIERELEKKYAP